MKNTPTLSIITVSLNAAAHIRRALESVARQNTDALNRTEHWVIDGASSDATLDIAHQFPHVQINSRKDSGISDAFNRGIQQSTGRWILILNSDDALADEHVLSDILPILQNADESGIDVVYGRIQIVDPYTQNTLRTAGRDRAWKALAQRMTLPHPATFVCRSYFERHGGFDTQFKIAMDYELLLRGLGQTKFQFVNRVITHFSAGGVSTTNAGWKQARECLTAKKKNNIASPFARLIWWAYQGSRWWIESKLSQSSILKEQLSKIARRVDRGY